MLEHGLRNKTELLYSDLPPTCPQYRANDISSSAKTLDAAPTTHSRSADLSQEQPAPAGIEQRQVQAVAFQANVNQHADFEAPQTQKVDILFAPSPAASHPQRPASSRARVEALELRHPPSSSSSRVRPVPIAADVSIHRKNEINPQTQELKRLDEGASDGLVSLVESARKQVAAFRSTMHPHPSAHATWDEASLAEIRSQFKDDRVIQLPNHAKASALLDTDNLSSNPNSFSAEMSQTYSPHSINSTDESDSQAQEEVRRLLAQDRALNERESDTLVATLLRAEVYAHYRDLLGRTKDPTIRSLLIEKLFDIERQRLRRMGVLPANKAGSRDQERQSSSADQAQGADPLAERTSPGPDTQDMDNERSNVSTAAQPEERKYSVLLSTDEKYRELRERFARAADAGHAFKVELDTLRVMAKERVEMYERKRAKMLQRFMSQDLCSEPAPESGTELEAVQSEQPKQEHSSLHGVAHIFKHPPTPISPDTPSLRLSLRPTAPSSHAQSYAQSSSVSHNPQALPPSSYQLQTATEASVKVSIEKTQGDKWNSMMAPRPAAPVVSPTLARRVQRIPPAADEPLPVRTQPVETKDAATETDEIEEKHPTDQYEGYAPLFSGTVLSPKQRKSKRVQPMFFNTPLSVAKKYRSSGRHRGSSPMRPSKQSAPEYDVTSAHVDRPQELKDLGGTMQPQTPQSHAPKAAFSQAIASSPGDPHIASSSTSPTKQLSRPHKQGEPVLNVASPSHPTKPGKLQTEGERATSAAFGIHGTPERILIDLGVDADALHEPRGGPALWGSGERLGRLIHSAAKPGVSGVVGVEATASRTEESSVQLKLHSDVEPDRPATTAAPNQHVGSGQPPVSVRPQSLRIGGDALARYQAGSELMHTCQQQQVQQQLRDRARARESTIFEASPRPKEPLPSPHIRLIAGNNEAFLSTVDESQLSGARPQNVAKPPGDSTSRPPSQMNARAASSTPFSSTLPALPAAEVVSTHSQARQDESFATQTSASHHDVFNFERLFGALTVGGFNGNVSFRNDSRAPSVAGGQPDPARVMYSPKKYPTAGSGSSSNDCDTPLFDALELRNTSITHSDGNMFL